MAKKIKRDYDSTTPEPFKPGQSDHTTKKENPDKTRRTEKNDPTRENDPDITSNPNNRERDDEDSGAEGSILNRTEV